MNHTPERGVAAAVVAATARPGADTPRRRISDRPHLSPRRRLWLETVTLALLLPCLMLVLAHWAPLWRADLVLTDQAAAHWHAAVRASASNRVHRLPLETACKPPVRPCPLSLEGLQAVLTEVLAQRPETVVVDAGHLVPDDARALQRWVRLRGIAQDPPVYLFSNTLQVPLDLEIAADGLVRGLRVWRDTPFGVQAHPVLAALGIDGSLGRWPSRVAMVWQPPGAASATIGPHLAGQRVVVGSVEAVTSRPLLLVASAGVVHMLTPMEALAQAMEQLAADQWLRPVPTALLALWVVIPLWLALAGTLRWPDQAGRVIMAVTLASALAWGVLWWWGRVVLPPLVMMVGLGVLMLIWRWRRAAMIRATLGRRVTRLKQLLPRALDQIDPRDGGLVFHETEMDGGGSHSARNLVDKMDSLLDSLEAHLQIQRRVRLQRDRWLAFLSHDLRSPQSNILSLVELHERGVGGMSNERLYQGVRRQVDRTLHLAEGVVDLLRADGDQLQLRHCALNELAADAIERCWPQSQAGHVRLHLREDHEQESPVVGDAELLTRVLVNLLSNAIRHSPAGSQVDVCVAWDVTEHQVVCAVRDEGAGMPEAQLECLVLALDPGSLGRTSSAPSTGPRKGHGLGLGLLVAHTVVTRHGGQLTAWSAPEMGTTFVLTLPAGVAQPRLAQPGQVRRERDESVAEL